MAKADVAPVERLARYVRTPGMARVLFDAVAENSPWVKDYNESTELLSLDGDLDNACAAWAEMMDLPGRIPSIVACGAAEEISAYLVELADEPLTEDPDLAPIGELMVAMYSRGLRDDTNILVHNIVNNLLGAVDRIGDGGHASKIAYILGIMFVRSAVTGTALTYIGSMSSSYKIVNELLAGKRGSRPFKRLGGMLAFHEDLGSAAMAAVRSYDETTAYSEAWRMEGFTDMVDLLDEIRAGYCDGSLGRLEGRDEISGFLEEYYDIEPAEGVKGRNCRRCGRWSELSEWTGDVCPRCGADHSSEGDLLDRIRTELTDWDTGGIEHLMETIEDSGDSAAIWCGRTAYSIITGDTDMALEAMYYAVLLEPGMSRTLVDAYLADIREAVATDRPFLIDGPRLAQVAVCLPEGEGRRLMDGIRAAVLGVPTEDALRTLAVVAVSRILTDPRPEAEDALLQAYDDISELAGATEDGSMRAEIEAYAGAMDMIYTQASGAAEWVPRPSRATYWLFMPLHTMELGLTGDPEEEAMVELQLGMYFDDSGLKVTDPVPEPGEPLADREYDALYMEALDPGIGVERLRKVADRMLEARRDDWRGWYVKGLSAAMLVHDQDTAFQSWVKAARIVDAANADRLVGMIAEAVIRAYAERCDEDAEYRDASMADASAFDRVLAERLPGTRSVLEAIVDSAEAHASGMGSLLSYAQDMMPAFVRMLARSGPEGQIGVCSRFHRFADTVADCGRGGQDSTGKADLFIRYLEEELQTVSGRKAAEYPEETLFIAISDLAAAAFALPSEDSEGYDEDRDVLRAEIRRYAEALVGDGRMPFRYY